MPIDEIEFPHIQVTGEKGCPNQIKIIDAELGILKTSQPYNLIINGNFANYPTTPGIAPNWTNISGSPTFTRQTQRTGNSPAGYVAQIQSALQNQGMKQTISCKPNTIYTFSGWIKRSAGSGNIIIRLEDNGASAEQHDLKIAPTDWQFIPTEEWGFIHIKTASDATQLILSFIIDTASDTYQFSDLVITEGLWFPFGYIQYTGAEAIDHTLLLNIGTKTHPQIDTHIADGTIHFTEASINHNALQNLAVGDVHTQYVLKSGSITQITTRSHSDLQTIGTNTHAQIDTHIADTTIHFTEASINHNNLTNLTTGDVHTQYAFLNGRIGGQTIYGGTQGDNNLFLRSTTDPNRGLIVLGVNNLSAFDDANDRLGIGTTSPSYPLDIAFSSGIIGARITRNSTESGFMLSNTSAGGNNWTWYSTGAGSGYGAGRLLLQGSVDSMFILAAGNVTTKVPNAVIADADILNNFVGMYIDETAHTLKFRVRYSDGTTMKTGTVALV